MLSAKYHILYWAVCATAAALYRALITSLPPEGVETAFRALLVPLSFYAVSVVRKGPRLHPSPNPHPTWYHLAATGCLLVSLGAFPAFPIGWGLQGQAQLPLRVGQQTMHALTHTLFAFNVLGALEPVRQNRRDIEPILISPGSYHRLKWPLPILSRANLLRQLYAILFCVFVTRGLAILVDYAVLQPPPVLESIRHDERRTNGLFSGTAVGYCLSAPFADVADTIFYFLHRRIFSSYIPAPGPLIRPGEDWIFSRLQAVILLPCACISSVVPSLLPVVQEIFSAGGWRQRPSGRS